MQAFANNCRGQNKTRPAELHKHEAQRLNCDRQVEGHLSAVWAAAANKGQSIALAFSGVLLQGATPGHL